MSLYTPATSENLEATAQRTDILHFMTISGNKGSEVYQQLGAGFTEMTESPSAQTKERKYINEKSTRKNIIGYTPNFAFKTLLMYNNPAIKKVYDISTQRKIGSDAIVEIITVDAFKAATNGAYPARKGNYAVEVTSCDDDNDMIITGNFNSQGDEAIGYFDPKKGVWSDEAPETSEPSGD